MNQEKNRTLGQHDCVRSHCPPLDEISPEERAKLNRENDDKYYSSFIGRTELRLVERGKVAGAKANELYIKFKPVLNHFSITGIAQNVEKADTWLSQQMIAGSDKAEEQKSRSFEGLELNIPLKKLTAAVSVVGALAVPVSNVAPVFAQKTPTVRAKIPQFDPEASRDIEESLSRDPALRGKFKPFVDVEDGNAVKLEPIVNSQTTTVEANSKETDAEPKPEVNDQSYLIDISNVSAIERGALSKAMNVEIAEGQTEVTITEPLVRNLKPGQNPTDLAKGLLGEKYAQNKGAVYQLTWVIVAMNDIDVSKGEDRVILPTDELILPYETADPTAVSTAEANRPTNEVAKADLIEITDIEKELNLLIGAVRSIENPEPMTDGPELRIVRETPVADKFEKQRERLLEELKSGETNGAFLQSQAIEELTLQHSGMTADGAARLMIVHVYEKAGMEPTQDEINSQAQDLLEGVKSDIGVAQSTVEVDGEKIDLDSKPLAEVQQELEQQLAEKTQALEKAGVRLDALGVSRKDVNETAKVMVNEENSGGLIGDEYYYLALDDIGGSKSVGVVRTGLSEAIYKQHQAMPLLENPDTQVELIEKTADTLSADYVNLGAFIDDVEGELAEKLDIAQQAIVPVLAEMISIFPEVEFMDEAALKRLVVDSVDGVSDDYIRMKVVEELAVSFDTPTRDVVNDYFIKAFEGAGLKGVVSQYQINELVDQVQLYWEGSAFDKENVQLDAQPIATELYDSALAELIVANEDYLDDEVDVGEIDQSKIQKILQAFLRLEHDTSYYDIRFIKALNVDTSAVEAYLRDYYEANGAGYYINQDQIITAVAQRLLAEPESSPEQYIESLGGYLGDPAEIFSEGKQYILTGYDGDDLTEFLKATGVNIDEILSSPLNAHIQKSEEGIFAEFRTIWFDDKSSVNEIAFKKAYDEIILGIKPPEVIKSTFENESATKGRHEHKEKDAKTEKLTAKQTVEQYGGALDSKTRETFKENDYSWEQIARLEVMLSSAAETPLPPNMVAEANDDGKFVMPEAYNGAYEFWGNTPEYQRSGALETVKAVVMVAQQWNLLYPDNPILVGDLDAKGHETHRDGVDTDIFVEGKLQEGNPLLRGEFVDNLVLAMLLGKAGAERLLLNDEIVAEAYNHWAKENDVKSVMVTTVPGHKGHIHVDWNSDWKTGVASSQTLAKGTIMHAEVDEEAEVVYEEFLKEAVENGEVLEPAVDGSLAKEEAEAAAKAKSEAKNKVAVEKVESQQKENEVIAEDAAVIVEVSKTEETPSISLKGMVDNIGNDETNYAYTQYISPQRLAEVDNMILEVASERGVNITPQGLAGLSAHIAAESGGKIEAVGGSNTRSALGIMQWEGDRQLDEDGNQMEMTLRGQIEQMFYDMKAFDENGGGSFGKPNMLGAIQDETLDIVEIVYRGYSMLLPKSFLEGGSEEEGGGNRLALAKSILEDYEN